MMTTATLLRTRALYDSPEDENWELLDSPKLTTLANYLSRHIRDDLRSRNRTMVPGLRFALRQIANADTGLL